MRTLQEIQPGQSLGRYEFLVPIAEGGMASVWAARLKGSRGFSKTVAIKTMLPGVSDDPAFEQMFLDEAQIASRIRHPNVAEILDLGEESEVLYLVMEWVDGEPLANLRRVAAKHGGVPRPIAVRLIADACAGLHAAHELKDERGALVGLVHRDMSPQNLLITFDGVVKVVDFGVAKAAGRSSEQTNAGQVKGKPPYMSPEQALGEVVDRRTDVFALGIILYQLTTGKHPFRGESDLVTLQNIVSDKAILSPRAYDKQYPRKLESVVMRALDRRRSSRFQTCADFESAIEDAIGTEITRARTEDVGRFVTEMLGDRGEQRRRALAESVRMADERAAGRLPSAELKLSVPSLSAMPSSPGLVITPTSTRSYPNAESRALFTDTDPSAVRGTPLDSTIPPARPTRRRTGIVVAALAAAAALGAVAAIRNSPKADAAVSAAAAARPPHPRVASPVVPTSATTEVVAAPSEAVAAPEPEAAPHAKGKHAARKPAPSAASSLAAARAALGVIPAPPPAAAPPPVAPTKPPAAPKPASKSGFVPPPVSDPGF
jgi:serine/threonine-protein kinase